MTLVCISTTCNQFDNRSGFQLNLLIESSVSSFPKMPGFFSHHRKLNPAPAGNLAAIPNSLYSKSFVEQKIHPDLNSLAEELTSSQGHEHLDMTADKGDPYAEATDFVGLEPSTRGGYRRNEAHTRTQEPQPAAMESIGIPVLDSASDTIAENFPNAESREDDIRLPGATSSPSSSPISIKASSSKNGWSIFGSNRTRVLHRNSDASNATSNVSRPRSQSSSSQPRSHSTSQRIATAASRTPKSQYSMYNSTGSTPSYDLERDGLLPSPHTFGISTPPKEPIAESADDNSYFGFRETPPPLPPLDHPAFRQASKKQISSASNRFPIQTNRDDVQNKFTRHSHSLPSLAHPGSNDTQCDKKSAKRRRRSFREELSSINNLKTDKKQHNRNDSVASSIETRRYSAEYSAKKASSVGHEDKDECWEVQVSKEMVRLALDATSPFGKACGKNVGFSICHQSCFIPFIFLVYFFSFSSSWRLERYWGLVHHFFCKASFKSEYVAFSPSLKYWLTMKNNNIDTLSRNLKDIKPPTAISSPKLIFKSSNVSAKPLRANIMSHASEYASRKGKERESGNTRVHSSHSRRSRTSSTPSMNRTPSPLPNIDTTPLSGSVAGASSLRVPQVSVISPTPDISPVTPSRRPHHKSQPTIPTTSVLQRPITPPVIGQQSSGKRKAEEADVGGDKTPPKDPKEQRATFAPDPRSMSPFFLSHPINI